MSCRRGLRRVTVGVLAVAAAACGGDTESRASGSEGSRGADAADVAVAAGPSQQADAFAPKAAIPDAVRRDPAAAMEVGVIEQAQVPSKDVVGVPAYPGAVVVGSTTVEEARRMYGEESMALPLVRVLSEAEPAAIASYYRERLGDDWHHAEKFGSHYFWTGQADLGMPALMDPAQARIQIGEASDWRVMPDARSDIFVVYDPER